MGRSRGAAPTAPGAERAKANGVRVRLFVAAEPGAKHHDEAGQDDPTGEKANGAPDEHNEIHVRSLWATAVAPQRLSLQGLLWPLVFSDGFAEAGSERVNLIAHSVADGGLDSVQALSKDRQERGRAAEVHRRERALVSRHDEEAEANEEREDHGVAGPEALHAHALPCAGGRCRPRRRL